MWDLADLPIPERVIEIMQKASDLAEVDHNAGDIGILVWRALSLGYEMAAAGYAVIQPESPFILEEHDDAQAS